MPTRVKGMTSIEIAVLVAIVLTIAVAVAWYLYTTFVASVHTHSQLRIFEVLAYPNGTMRFSVVNTGSSYVYIVRVEVLGTLYMPEGGWVPVPPGGGAVFSVSTGRTLRAGMVIQGRLITSEGYSFPFTVRVSW